MTNDADEPLTFPVGRFEGNLIRNPRCVVVGELSCEDVEGKAYLEMWAVYRNSERYFSRTLADGGPLQSITGDQMRRDFALPFDTMGRGFPDQLEINLLLPGLLLTIRAVVPGALFLLPGIAAIVIAAVVLHRAGADRGTCSQEKPDDEFRKMQAMDG